MDDGQIEEETAIQQINAALMQGLARQGINYNDLLSSAYSKDQELAAKWVRGTILPEDMRTSPLRYHSPANQFPSAALGVVDFRNIRWQFLPSVNNVQAGPGDMFICTFDDNPLDIVHIYDPNPNYKKCQYDWMFNGNTLLRWTQSGSIQANKAMHVDDPANFDFHGLYLYTQYDNANNRYFWVDALPGAVASDGTTPAPSTIVLTMPGITAAPSTFLFTVGLYRYFGGAPKLCATKVVDATIPLTGPGGTGQLTFTLNNSTDDPDIGIFRTYSDYYTVRLAYARSRTATVDAVFAEAQAAILGGVSIRSTSTCSVLKHIAVKEVESIIQFFSEKGRINALGLRVTDVPMLQYQNGLIAGFVCLNGNSWYQYWQHGLQLGTALYDRVATANGALVHEIWKGGYMWHKPADDTFYFWQRWVNWDEQTRQPSDLGVNLETTRPVNIIAMTATNDFTTGNPNGGGCVAAATWGILFEWLCPVSIYTQEVSEYTTAACQIGIDAVGKFPSFTDNDSHWDKFLAYSAQVADHGMPLWNALIRTGEGKLAKLTNPKIAGAVGNLARRGVKALAKRARAGG